VATSTLRQSCWRRSGHDGVLPDVRGVHQADHRELGPPVGELLLASRSTRTGFIAREPATSASVAFRTLLTTANVPGEIGWVSILHGDGMRRRDG
jgi:hypothetical protein